MNDPKLTAALKHLTPVKPVLERQGDCLVITSHRKSKEGTPFIRKERMRFSIQEIQWKAHHPGERIPQGKQITENCQTRGCLNPQHLAPLSHREIILARGNHKSGEANGRAKLTAEQAAIIKNSPEASLAALAKHFNVSKGCVQDIRNGRNWANLVPPEGTPIFSTPPPPETGEEEKRERELGYLTQTEYPHAEKLRELGLSLEADFIAPLLPRPQWERDTPRWKRSTIGKIEYDLEPERVDGYAAQLIVQTAGFLHTKETPEHASWREALQRPTILQDNNCWQALTKELLAQPSKEEAIEVWKNWLQGPKSAKHTAMRSGIRNTLRRVLNHLKKELVRKQRECVGAGGKKDERPFPLHHTASSALRWAKIKTLPEVALLSPQEIYDLGGFGEKTFPEITLILAKKGLKFRENPHEIELLSTSKEDWTRNGRLNILEAFWATFCRDWWRDEPEYSTESDYEKIRSLYNITSADFPTWPGPRNTLERWEKSKQAA